MAVWAQGLIETRLREAGWTGGESTVHHSFLLIVHLSLGFRYGAEEQRGLCADLVLSTPKTQQQLVGIHSKVPWFVVRCMLSLSIFGFAY